MSGKTSNMKTTIPNPPIKWVEDRQNSRPFGKTSTSVSMDAPVVVRPETLSKKAFTNVNSPPPISYGSMAKIQERSHAKMMIINPSLTVGAWFSRTKIMGKIPAAKVIMPLMTNGTNAASKSFIADTPADRNMKTAFASKAIPMYLDMTLIFIF